jgi:MtN3 and saliva related transmembrane protein
MKTDSIAPSSKVGFFPYFEKYMLVIGVLGQLLYYIQGAKILINQSAQDVSLLGFSLGFVSVSSWLTYGILIKDRALIVANIFAVLGAAFVIIGVLIYGI